MSIIIRVIAFCALIVIAACKCIPTHSYPAGASIEVDHPEVFDNAQLQTSLDTLRGQLSSLGIVDTGTLTGALGATQGTTVSSTNFSFQALARGTPSVTTVVPSIAATAAQGTGDTRSTTVAGLTPSVPAAASAPAAPTLPSVANDSIGLIQKQMQLESQLQGYQLLLGGSDFARYTISGLAKDRVVIGFPITIRPQDIHKNMAAEVEITYFPPNANQFKAYPLCTQRNLSPTETAFSAGDKDNAPLACQEQESTPTIINILPTERSYDVVGVFSSATSLGAGALVGTVSIGASGGTSHQTQYLIAQQDTIALQGNGTARCLTAGETGRSPSDEIIVPDPSTGEHCIPGTRGVRFQWQFRPVLGEAFVRPGRRTTFVQLAIPNVRRPYPNYGGIIYVRKRWKPIDTDTGVVKEAPVAAPDSTDSADPEFTVSNVLGHTFISSEVSSIEVSDLGSGSLLVSLKGTYLTGASVRVGSTLYNSSTTGFLADYNSLKFVTTAQALAQSGAVLMSSEGVESRVDLSSICKSWDDGEECALQSSTPSKMKIVAVSVSPVSDSNSLVRLRLAQPTLKIEGYTYYHYQKNPAGDVMVSLDKRAIDDTVPHPISPEHLEASVNKWPIVLNLGSKVYGFTDLPFQAVSGEGGFTDIAVVASNDSINTSPQVKVQRLFGNPGDDSDWRAFVPPGRLAIAVDPEWVAQRALSGAKDVNGPCNPDAPCRYVISGADVDQMDLKKPLAKASLCKANPVLATEPFESNTRGLTIAGCARQVALTYQTGEPKKDFDGEIVLPLWGPTATVADPTKDAVPPAGTLIPHLQMVRAVQQVSESQGSASITVGIKNLKDQTATVTVQYADIVTAKDGSGNALPIQPGNNVVITQDTSITFQVRNYSSKAVNVQAEGKNGTASTGKLQFSTGFAVVKEAAGGGTGTAGNKGS